MSADQLQSNWRFAALVARKGKRATIHQIHPRRVAQNKRIGFEEQIVIGDKWADKRRYAGNGRRNQRIEPAEGGMHPMFPESQPRQRQRRFSACDICLELNATPDARIVINAVNVDIGCVPVNRLSYTAYYALVGWRVG